MTSESRSWKSEKLRRLYRQFPDAYAGDVFDARLTDEQAGILLSLVDTRYTAVKASHAIGKTWCAAIGCNWWYDCWDEHIAYITAPTWPQCLGLTFKQIKLLRRQFGLPGEILETGWVRDPNPARAPAHFIRALNAESGEGFQGEHTAPILQIYEEAVGVPPYIWESGSGLMTAPECRLLAIANPTDEATPFGQACAGDKFRVISVCAMDHPNIAAELACTSAPFPKAVRLQWLYEMLSVECERVASPMGDAFTFWSLPAIEAALRGQPITETSEQWHYLPSAVFQGRVLGDFPSQADQQVIPRGWLRDLPVKPLGLLPEIGCDVARHGTDRTTIAVRSGAGLLYLTEIRRMDVDVVAGTLKRLADELGPLFRCPPQSIPIRVDVTGGLGVAPAVMLARQDYNAIEVNSSSKAIEEEKYPNTRSELWFVLRDRARTKDLDLSRLPDDMRQKLERELATPTWKNNSRGQRVVEPKPDIKKRLGESPDLADAVALAYYSAGEGWESLADDPVLAAAAKELEVEGDQAQTSESATVRW